MNKPWYKKWWGIILIIIGTFILISIVAFGFYVASIIKTLNNPLEIQNISYQDIDEEVRIKIEGEDNYWIGSANPKITIVEFSDFNCPYCRNSFSKMREISIKYKNDVKVIFRDLPLLDNSTNLHLAGRCAGEQGLFWLMHDKLFQNQGITNLEEVYSIANQIGVDNNKFKSCLNSNKYINKIQKDFTDAEDLKVTGTPTWFINGQKIEGDIPYSVFAQIIDRLLEK